MEVTNEILIFLFTVALVAGFIDTLAGGGGLITIPSMMISGVPPLLVLGTNKLQGVVGTATATIVLLRSKKLDRQQIKRPVMFALLGSTLGTIAVQFIDTQALKVVVPVVLACIGVYFLLSPLLKINRNPALISERRYCHTAVPSIGFYDGMFGPGTGSFFTMAAMAFRGKGIVEATVAAKPLNFATNLASVVVFIISGHIAWKIGAVMMLGQFIGSRTAASMLFNINRNVLRYLVVIMCTAMLVKYFS